MHPHRGFPTPDPTLTRRLAFLWDWLNQDHSGPDRLLSLLIPFYQRMSEDVLVGFFFTGRPLDPIARHQRDFLLFAWGRAETYSGKKPLDAHLPLPPILKGHFDRRLHLLEEVLLEQGVPPTLVETWVQFENGFRALLVQEEGV